MYPNSLPYFHVDALRERFFDHLAKAVVRDSLDAETQHWLSAVLQPERDALPGAVNELRVDCLSAISTAGEVITLTASLLLSRSTHTPVFFYQPLIGLLRFENRSQLKDYLIEQLGSGRCGPLLHYASQHERQTVARGVETVQVTLLDGPVFIAQMLAIAPRLALALNELGTLLHNQPAADSLWEAALANTPATATLTHKRLSAARYCSQQLRQYWNTTGSGDSTPAQQLTRLMRERLRQVIIQQAWAAALSAAQQAQLLAWLDEQAGAELHAWHLTVTTLDGDSQMLEGLLVLASVDASGPLFSYCAARGLQQHASRRALLSALADPLQRERWLTLVSPSRQAHLRSLRINALRLDRLTTPSLDSWTGQLLRAQQRDIETQTSLQDTPDAYQACRQALAIGSQLAPDPSLLGNLPALAQPGPGSLAQREGAVRAGSASLDDLHVYLSTLATRIEVLEGMSPDLATVTTTALDQAFAALLDNTLAVSQLVTFQGTDRQHPSSLAERVWQRLSATEGEGPWQIVGPTVAEQPVALPALHPMLVAQCISQVASASREALAVALQQHQRHLGTYCQHLWQLALGIEYRLVEHDNTLPRLARELI
ncbi:hypothetical protein G3435_06265, partial [Pseudomonas sp. MAFF212428]|nr:hypothetical protein [Pseudomonas brassicae]